MVYTMEIYIDSGCRNLGTTRAIGSAAAILTNKGERSNKWTTDLRRGPRLPPPTIQRAELTSVILAIDIATIRFEQLDTKPYLDVKIHSNSEYAIDCMTNRIHQCNRNGWMDDAGDEVENRDLMEKVLDLEDLLRDKGDVSYFLISREENQEATEFCNRALDDQSRELGPEKHEPVA
ncbi:hypothetical protein TWF225_012058 [Orbilia oligospora]|uniref:Uncharacterized protein n=1 Tax=Orbilia oligospora TaxID=2813651 RepID=A0A7C8PEB9_ORBOL|nr:hypothetical protein TWF225_012058 [Orbilia oligospora]KAF3174845.1 hypothetical protein TWF751_004598 [Orbilia oligospora]KAF3236489.1 hypothetical protein TWF128_001354 [Orbilia oligospora]KAF3266144.1 hypothetical protein TWF217_001825 [Orbilia oligospora]KAF3297199.1 hypothetical protein TWF132_008554 [Orbilia oligospora]